MCLIVLHFNGKRLVLIMKLKNKAAVFDRDKRSSLFGNIWKTLKVFFNIVHQDKKKQH